MEGEGEEGGRGRVHEHGCHSLEKENKLTTCKTFRLYKSLFNL